MASLNAAQLDQITFFSSVDAQGLLAPNTFWNWNGSSYAALSYQAKWGPTAAGTGASVSVTFDAASHWTATEQQGFVAAMSLWSAIANIKFTVSADPANVPILITRSDDGEASGGIEYFFPGSVGTPQLGRADTGAIMIDTDVPGFGPIDGKFATQGGYVWMTLVHEFGHILGLGHTGAYDTSESDFFVSQYGGYDTRGWSIMSYVDVSDRFYPDSIAPPGGFNWVIPGNALSAPIDLVPTTWMPLDIVAAQRLYGVATDGPLTQGGQVFGFHSNIQGDIAPFFDFTVNTRPIVTLWDGGLNNTLDVSGFSVASSVSLESGTFSSVAGLRNNVAIAYGTRIDNAVGGSGNDTIRGNENHDVLMGGTGSDSIIGGAGNDHIYGNMLTSIAGAVDAGDYIETGGGSNYVNGNAGNDTIVGGDGSNRLYGGQGDDHITAGNGNNSINGNLGNDEIVAGNGNNIVRGGQGDDVLRVGSGSNVMLGDLGNDRLYAGAGYDRMTGGDGADLFEFGAGTAGSALPQFAEITDFGFGGADRIALTFAVGQVAIGSAGSVALALVAAQGLLSSVGQVAALQVGADTYLFYNASGAAGVGNAIHLDNVAVGTIDTGDFTLFA